MAILARFKQTLQDVAPQPLWKFLRKGFGIYRNEMGWIVSHFPFVLHLLPKTVAQTLLSLALQDMYNRRESKKIEKLKKFAKNYQNNLKIYLAELSKAECTDEILLKNNLTLATFLTSGSSESTDIHIDKPSVSSPKIKILHLVSWFSTESSLLAILDSFFAFSDREKFSHLFFTGRPLSKEAKSFFQKYNFETIQKSFVKNPIDCDIVLDWDGFASPHNLRFSEEKRPLVVSIANEFLPKGKDNRIVSFKSTAELSHLKNGSLIEKSLWKIPDTAIFDFMGDPLPLPYQDLPVLKNGFITFGSFSHVFKMSEMTFEVWGEILRSLPNSRLEICSPCYVVPSYKNHVFKKLIAQKIEPHRISFDTLSGYPQYCKKFPTYDIILGALPYAGGRTSFHLTESGFFQLALMRQNFVNTRLFKSIFLSTNTPELILETPQHYIQMAQNLAANPDQIIDLRTRIRTAIANYRENHKGELTRLVEQFILKTVRP